jgi:hypothetical protein
LDRPPLPLESSLPGVFAVGDVRHGSVKRVASAVGEGSICVRLVHEYLADAAVDAVSPGPDADLSDGATEERGVSWSAGRAGRGAPRPPSDTLQSGM